MAVVPAYANGVANALGPGDRQGKVTTMIFRRATERGHANHGWLDSYHTFSFADYYDPKHTGFRALLVINEDRVQPGQGFGTHAHRDMEIISQVLEGALEHKDSIGNGGVIRPGDIQRMSAGTGVRHSEFNASKTEPVHFLQIWIKPDKAGYPPSYEQKTFSDAEKRGRLRLVASPDGQDGAVTIHQDARVYGGLFDRGENTSFELAAGRHAWIHLAQGMATINGEILRAGDAAAVDGPDRIGVVGEAAAEILLFDLP